MHTYYFEKLDVWQISRLFVKDLYMTSRHFPNEEKFGLTGQIRRAAISIPANIAEGFSRNTNKDKAHFINIAYASAMEVLNFLILSNDLEYLSNIDLLRLRLQIEMITNKLNALHKTLIKVKE
jgi:four helix bundle protein